MHSKFGWLAIIGVIGIGGFALWWQRETQTRLRGKIGELRQQTGESVRLREENRRLAAAQPTVAELENLRADHVAIPELRAEIDAMQARTRTTADKLPARSPERFEPGSKVLASDWRNAGTTTAKATLETVLWAAAGGDIDTFAQCLLLAEGRKGAMALLESLPSAMREQYGTPERLVAFLAIKDVPLGAAQVMEWNEIKTSKSLFLQADLRLSGSDGKAKDLILRFSNQGAGWKLVVPQIAIAKYAAMLKGPTVATGK